MNPDRLAITGSTEFVNRGSLGKAAALIGAVLDTQRPDVVLVAAIDDVPQTGVAALADQAARSRNIPVQSVSAWNRRWQGYGGYQWRAHQIVRGCTRLLDLRCGEDARWTARYGVDLARRRALPVEALWGI